MDAASQAGHIGDLANYLIGTLLGIALIVISAKPELVTKKEDVLEKLRMRKKLFLILGILVVIINCAMMIAGLAGMK